MITDSKTPLEIAKSLTIAQCHDHETFFGLPGPVALEVQGLYPNDPVIMGYMNEIRRGVKGNDKQSHQGDVFGRMENEPREKRKKLNPVLASDVEIKPIDWMWHPFFPNQNVSILAGEGGVGKTFLVCSIIAAITNCPEGIMPEGMPGDLRKRGICIYFGAEDGKDAIAARLKMCGANLSKVVIIDSAAEYKDTEIWEIIKQYEPVFVVFDPVQSFMLKKANSNSQNEVRNMVDDLREYSRIYNTAILIVAHPNKMEGLSLKHRISGSGDFVNACRSALYVGNLKDKQNTRGVFHIKANSGRKSKPFTYDLLDAGQDEVIFAWGGIDNSITAKDIEQPENIRDALNLNKAVIGIIENVMKINPNGFKGTAGEILKEYQKIAKQETVNSKILGKLLSSNEVTAGLEVLGITIFSTTRGNQNVYYVNRILEQVGLSLDNINPLSSTVIPSLEKKEGIEWIEEDVNHLGTNPTDKS